MQKYWLSSMKLNSPRKWDDMDFGKTPMIHHVYRLCLIYVVLKIRNTHRTVLNICSGIILNKIAMFATSTQRKPASRPETTNRCQRYDERLVFIAVAPLVHDDLAKVVPFTHIFHESHTKKN